MDPPTGIVSRACGNPLATPLVASHRQRGQRRSFAQVAWSTESVWTQWMSAWLVHFRAARFHLLRLTAPESVGRRCAQLRGSGADLALGPRLVHGALAFWMQTSGTALLTVERCSLVRVWMAAQDSHSAHGLLYL